MLITAPQSVFFNALVVAGVIFYFVATDTLLNIIIQKQKLGLVVVVYLKLMDVIIIMSISLFLLLAVWQNGNNQTSSANRPGLS